MAWALTGLCSRDLTTHGNNVLGLQVIHMVTDLLQDDVGDISAAADEILETAIREEPSYAEGIRTLRFEACNAQWLGSFDQMRGPDLVNKLIDEPEGVLDSAIT